MIRVKCQTCGKSIQAKDKYAGRKVKCPNCESPILIPPASSGTPKALAGNPTAAKAAAPPKAAAPNRAPAASANPDPPIPTETAPAVQQPAGQTIVVQMQQQPAGGMIGPEQKSLIVVWLLAWVCAGLQYFYLGQMGKGVLFTLLTLLFWSPVLILTCGVGLIGFFPYAVLLLVDSQIVASRMRTEAISQWRFF